MYEYTYVRMYVCMYVCMHVCTGEATEELEIIDEDESLPDEFFLDLLERVRLGSLAAKMGGGDARKGLRKVLPLNC